MHEHDRSRLHKHEIFNPTKPDYDTHSSADLPSFYTITTRMREVEFSESNSLIKIPCSLKKLKLKVHLIR